MFKDVLVSQNLDVSNFLVQKGLNTANQSHFRSSHQEVFCEKGVLRNAAKLTGNHLSQSLFLWLICDILCGPFIFFIIWWL